MIKPSASANTLSHESAHLGTEKKLAAAIIHRRMAASPYQHGDILDLISLRLRR